MRTENAIALKEWAAVCAALLEGRQSVLLRKGGIAEGPSGFRLDHDEFWLYHQSSDQLAPDAGMRSGEPALSPPSPGRILLPGYAVVRAVAFVSDERTLSALTGLHVLSGDVVSQRFHYRRPGLFVAAVQVFRQSPPHDLPERPAYAGCHSWVTVDGAVPTSGLVPVEPRQPSDEVASLVLSLAK
jgi:hypothetical protein